MLQVRTCRILDIILFRILINATKWNLQSIFTRIESSHQHNVNRTLPPKGKKNEDFKENIKETSERFIHVENATIPSELMKSTGNITKVYNDYKSKKNNLEEQSFKGILFSIKILT